MGKARRDSLEICKAILSSLSTPKTINEVAGSIGAGWGTTKRCLDFLEQIGYITMLVGPPRPVYKRSSIIKIPEQFINDLRIIIKKKGSRHYSLEDCVNDALWDFIHKEKHIRRY